MTAIMTVKRVRRTLPTPLMTTRRMIQMFPSDKYYHMLVQRRLRQDIRFSNHARVLKQKRPCGSSWARRSCMTRTTRTDATGRDGSREECMGATSTRCCACSHSQFFVRYSKSLTVCVKKKKLIPLCLSGKNKGILQNLKSATNLMVKCYQNGQMC